MHPNCEKKIYREKSCHVSQQASLADLRMMPDYGLPTYFENHKYMTLCIQQYMTKLETLSHAILLEKIEGFGPYFAYSKGDNQFCSCFI